MQVHKIFLRRLSVLELSATEFSVLVLVGANPGVYLRQLGSALDVSPPNLVAVVDRLVQRGVLARLPSAEDRRLQELHLTDAGRHLLARAEAQVEMFETGLEQSLSAAERRCLDSALKKLAAFDPPRADPSGDPRDDPNQAGA